MCERFARTAGRVTYEYVSAVSADDGDQNRKEDAGDEAGAFERLRHRQNPGAERRFQQMGQRVHVSERCQCLLSD